MQKTICAAIVQNEKVLLEKKGKFLRLPQITIKKNENLEDLINSIKNFADITTMTFYGKFEGLNALTGNLNVAEVYLAKINQINNNNEHNKKYVWSNNESRQLLDVTYDVMQALKKEGYIV